MFLPEEFTVGPMRPLTSSGFDSWLERNPSEEEKIIVHDTVEELALVFTQMKASMATINSVEQSVTVLNKRKQ